MNQQTSGSSIPGTAANSQEAPSQARRNCWIVTAYAIAFLALCGILAYFFSGYITH
jgi:Na+-driven multidrug efflux pump